MTSTFLISTESDTTPLPWNKLPKAAEQLASDSWHFEIGMEDPGSEVWRCFFQDVLVHLLGRNHEQWFKIISMYIPCSFVLKML